MSTKKFGLFRRITILIFILIAVLGLLFMGITYFATTQYHLASTQLLNKDVAKHIAKFASPFDRNGLNKRKADSVFKDAMVISPSAEVYFLDTAGNVMDFYGPTKDIKQWKLSLANIDKYIADSGANYIKAPDPRDPARPKIFSAAEVTVREKKLGYIYVILGSNQYRSVSSMLFGSHVGKLAIKASLFIIALSILLSLLYVNRMQKSFNHTIGVLEKFQRGDYAARFTVKDKDEWAPVSKAFNQMADLLSHNINRLTRSEKERKDFIANVSHDLRTPLAIARGYVETVHIKKTANGLIAAENESYLQLALQKILQVENMVKQLFELSKMEAVEFEPKSEPFVLSEIVQEAVNTFQLVAAEKKVDLKCTQCQYHVWINADISMMERVVQNLIDNAVKSTPEGGRIQIGMSVEEADLIFKIENTGPPLPDDILQWVNDAQPEAERTKRPAKMGLGLVIVKRILSLHGFSLKAYRSDSGNVFSFRVPIVNPT